MYGYKNEEYTNDDKSTSKTIRFNKDQIEIVERYGRRRGGFSAKLKYIINDYERLRKEIEKIENETGRKIL